MGKGHDERLVYGVQLTAYDFLTLANDNPHHLKAYDDLSSCAVCCAATAVYQRIIGADFAHEKLLYVDASLYLQNIGHSSSTQLFQPCFDKLLQKFGKINHGKLNAKQLAQFTHQFNTQCVSSN